MYPEATMPVDALEDLLVQHMRIRHARISADVALALRILKRCETPIRERELAESVRHNKGESGNEGFTRFRSALYWLMHHRVLEHCIHERLLKIRLREQTVDPLGSRILAMLYESTPSEE